MDRDDASIIAIVLGAIVWVIAARRFARLRYSAPAFFSVSLGTVAAYYRDWLVVAVSAGIAVVFVAVDWLRKPPQAK